MAVRSLEHEAMSHGHDHDPLADPALYTNFHVSWLAFNERVMEEAEDQRHPLLERAKFLAIVTDNLDEFFMVRVAALRQARDAGAAPHGDDDLPPTEVLHAINERSQALVERQLRCFVDDVQPALTHERIHLLSYDQLDESQRAALTDHFNRDIAPVLTPLAIDDGHPFPFISSQSLNLLILLEDGSGQRVARLRIPPTLPRLVPVPTGAADGAAHDDRHQSACFVWLEQVVAANVHVLFHGHRITATYPFRVVRNGEDRKSTRLNSSHL